MYKYLRLAHVYWLMQRGYKPNKHHYFKNVKNDLQVVVMTVSTLEFTYHIHI
jgi:hypothetical protein